MKIVTDNQYVLEWFMTENEIENNLALHLLCYTTIGSHGYMNFEYEQTLRRTEASIHNLLQIGMRR